MSGDPLLLLNPEWQGYGLSSEVYVGARALAADVLAGRPFATVEVPEHEQLELVEGVLGLHSIAPRFLRTLAMLRRESPDRIFSIGGTCGTELAPVAYLNERWKGRMAVLWLDAHADLNTPETSPSAHFHGMVLRTLLGHGPSVLTTQLTRPLVPAQVVLAGTRDFDAPELAFVDVAPIAHFGLAAFRDPQILLAHLRAAGFHQVYVHLDLDVINPDSFTGALLPVPGGPVIAEVEAVVTTLASECDVVGLSVLEYCERGDAAPRSSVSALLIRLQDALMRGTVPWHR